MTCTVTFHPEALEEYKAASVWYEERQEGLGIQFEKIIDNKINQILRNPLAFAKRRGTYRQAKTRTFPFVIVYKVNNRINEVYISAIFHTGRSPKRKYRSQ